VVVAIDFRSSNQEPYPASVADVNYATRWLNVHATEFNASPEAVGGLGTSSGAHLIMLSAMRPRDPRYAALPLADAPDADAGLAYVLLAWPGVDPLAVHRDWSERGRDEDAAMIMQYFGDEAGLREANPQLILERGEAVELPPALVLQGTADDQARPEMAERFVATYSRAGGLVELALFPGEGHGFIRDPGPNTNRALDLMKSFIARQLLAIAAV
jgi:acetyl esterase